MSDRLEETRANLERIIELMRREGFALYADSLIQPELERHLEHMKRCAAWDACKRKADR
jgi:hypothetical protein